MTPNGHLNVGVVCIQTGCRVSGGHFQFLAAIDYVLCRTNFHFF